MCNYFQLEITIFLGLKQMQKLYFCIKTNFCNFLIGNLHVLLVLMAKFAIKRYISDAIIRYIHWSSTMKAYLYISKKFRRIQIERFLCFYAFSIHF